jgi:ATP-dependent helicase/nuclease subunit A
MPRKKADLPAGPGGLPERQQPPAPAPSDEKARAAIEHDMDISMLVEAGAGSGKTTRLARRMVAVVREGRHEIDRLAAITFTRKAAAELRGRFQIELERAAKGEADPDRRRRAEAALARLERLFTGTIHAFCSRMLRERPIEAGVTPDFAEIEDDEDAALRRQAWNDFLAGLHAAGDPRMAALQDVGLAAADLESALQTVCLYPEVEFPAPAVTLPDAGEAMRALKKLLGDLDPFLPKPLHPDTTCPIQKTIRALRREARVTEPGRPAGLAELLVRCEKERKAIQKWWPGGKAKALEAEGIYNAFAAGVAAPFLSAWRAHVYHVAMQVLLPAREAVAKARIGAGGLNYQDQLLQAAALLRDNAEVRAFFQDRFRCLFVDEFQDTDPIQAEVILLLSAKDPGERDWTKVRPRPGALFVVGDPKQSIYRFRRADIGIYNQVREAIETRGGEIKELTRNFRSVGRICDWANDAFRGVFPGAPTLQRPAFAPLAADRAAGAPDLCGVRTLTVPTTDGGSQRVARLEAAAIARFIRHAVEGGRTIEGGSQDLPGPRPARYGDFMILTRRKKNVATYAAALEELSIPCEVGGGGAFLDAGPVASLRGLLQALADPEDAVALVGVLRGPLFGLSDDDLYRHRAAGKPFRIPARGSEAEGRGAEGDARAAAALASLGEWYGWTRTLPLGAATERVLDASGLLAWAAAGEAGQTAAGNLLKAVDRVRAVAEQGGGMAQAAESLAGDLESKDIEAQPLEPGRRDVVRVMNLHKAKGLEAPVVFLADPLTGQKPRADIRIVRGEGRAEGFFCLARTWGDHGRDVLGVPRGWEDVHEPEELQYVGAEEERLRYVAATRARDLLVVGRYGGKAHGAQTPPWIAFEGFLTGVPELEVPAEVPAPAEGRADLSPRARAAAAEARAARLAAAARPSFAVEAVTAIARMEAGGRPAAARAEAREEADRGAAWGTLIHGMLEAAMRSGDGLDEAALQRLAAFLAAEESALRPHIPDAVATVLAVMQSEVWRRARQSPERHLEVPFAVQVPTEELRPRDPEAPPVTVLQGRVDLAYRVDGGWELVDYKTDAIEGDPAPWVEHYAPQVRLYARHWAAIGGEPVLRAGLFFTRPNRLVWLP